jgi:hypothetical protein
MIIWSLGRLINIIFYKKLFLIEFESRFTRTMTNIECQRESSSRIYYCNIHKNWNCNIFLVYNIINENRTYDFMDTTQIPHHRIRIVILSTIQYNQYSNFKKKLQLIHIYNNTNRVPTWKWISNTLNYFWKNNVLLKFIHISLNDVKFTLYNEKRVWWKESVSKIKSLRKYSFDVTHNIRKSTNIP